MSRPPDDDGQIPGLRWVRSATDYEGPAVRLVAALKQGSAVAARAAAELILESLGPPPGDLVLVPVAAARLRSLRRGLDPAQAIADALARSLSRPSHQPLRRGRARPQRGRSRDRRLSDPPPFHPIAAAPPRPLLVDDVLTTGATLASCAAALREAGAVEVAAITFARTPHPAPCLSRGEA